MKVTVLGCGSSPGVPMIGCNCAVCLSQNPRNKRTRVSVVVEDHDKTVLIDTSPDLRQQFLANGFSRMDAIIYTHAHADHTHGIDEVRALNQALDGPIKVYMDAETLDGIKGRFSYAFQPPIPEYGWFRPCMEPVIVERDSKKPFKAAGLKVIPLNQVHGRGYTMGLRIGKFAYSTDTNGLPDESIGALKGIEVWLVDCLRKNLAPTHAHLAMVLEWVAKVKPRLAVLTHMSHEMDYEDLSATLPPGVVAGYDGMVIDI